MFCTDLQSSLQDFASVWLRSPLENGDRNQGRERSVEGPNQGRTLIKILTIRVRVNARCDDPHAP